jgi:hypothetical protein
MDVNDPSANESPQPAWWPIPKAVAWIVGRSEALVDRASRTREIEELMLWEDLLPVAVRDEPPISLTAAPAELLRAALAGHITIHGRYNGTGELGPVPIRSHVQPWLEDYGSSGPAIRDRYDWRSRSCWSELLVRSQECMTHWPAPPLPATNNISPYKETVGKPGATDNQMRDWMLDHQVNLKKAGRRHGRDVILDAAKDEFHVRHKVVLAVWKARHSAGKL